MSIWSKVLAWLILLTSIAFFYLATRALASHRAWQLAAQSYDAPLEKFRKQIALLEEGNDAATPPTPSRVKLEVALHDLMVGRGKVWRACAMKRFDPATLQVMVEVPFPEPHLLHDKMVLYLFEEGPGGHFLGEYKVVGTAEKAVSLAPAMMPPTPDLFKRQAERIRNTKFTWSIFEKLPTDRHDVFRGFDQAQLAQMMPGVPAKVLQEYLRDGSDAQASDPPDRVFNGKYERLLRDYEVYLHELNAQIARLRDQIAAANTDKAIAEKLKTDTEKEIEARQALIDKTLKPDLAEAQGEAKVIAAHYDALSEKLDGKKDDNGKLLVKGVSQQAADARDENKRLLAQWTALQVGTAKRLNELIERDTAGPVSTKAGSSTGPTYTGE